MLLCLNIKRKIVLLCTIVIVMAFFLPVAGQCEKEAEKFIHSCLSSSESQKKIYFSFLPFMDEDTNSSTLMTDDAQIIYDAMFSIYQQITDIIGCRINEKGHMTKPTDMNVRKIVEIASRPMIPEKKKFELINKQFIKPFHTDVIVTASYRELKDNLLFTFYFVVKSKKRVIISHFEFSKLTFFCESIDPSTKTHERTICKNHQSVVLHILFDLFLSKACTGFEDMLNNPGHKTQKQQNANPVYLSYMTFLDPITGSSLHNTQEGHLINQAIEEAMIASQMKNAAIVIKKGADKQNSANCNKLANLLFDPNLSKDEKLKKISSELLLPNNLNGIITGQLFTRNNQTNMIVMLILKGQTNLDTKKIKLDKEILCPEAGNPQLKQLCPETKTQLYQAVQDLIEHL